MKVSETITKLVEAATYNRDDGDVFFALDGDLLELESIGEGSPENSVVFYLRAAEDDGAGELLLGLDMSNCVGLLTFGELRELVEREPHNYLCATTLDEFAEAAKMAHMLKYTVNPELDTVFIGVPSDPYFLSLLVTAVQKMRADEVDWFQGRFVDGSDCPVLRLWWD